MSVDAAFASLVTTAKKAPNAVAPEFVRGAWTNTALRLPETTAAQYDALRAAQLRSGQRNTELLRQWWLAEMIGGAAPLRENLVLFFHGTFGSSTGSVEIPHALHGCNALLRRSCLGTVPALLEQLVLDPAMMMQIGMDEHRKERVSDRPAKLILDYWTVGVGQYADSDVENLSRALTGWVLAAPRGNQPTRLVDPNAARAARRTGLVPTFEPEQFDAGTKTILGTTRAFDARSAMGFLARHPATARRFSQHLVRYLGVEDPNQRLQTRLVATYRATDGSVEALLRDIVRSEEFWSTDSRWSLIKSPVHLAVGACRQLEIPSPPLAEMSRFLAACGQTLFDTPNSGEGGWAGQEAWVTPPDRLAVRYQLPIVLSGHMPQLGIQANRSRAELKAAPIQLRLGATLKSASASTLLARLDPAPGLDVSEIEREASGVEANGRESEIIRRVMMTPQYQMA